MADGTTWQECERAEGEEELVSVARNGSREYVGVWLTFKKQTDLKS